MDNANRLEAITPVLRNYQLEPHFVEEFGKVQKVYSNKGTFALKKISPAVGTDFIRHVHYLYQKGYNRIVPIFPTIDGRYAVLDDKYLYYLMPWLPDEVNEGRNSKHMQLFRELARLHTITSKEINVKSEERKEHYEKTIQEMEKNSEFLEGFIEECELKTYMSPFELLFCLYYNEMNQAIRFSKAKFEEWYDGTKEQEKARMVVIHGKISGEHFLFDERGYGYFTNFEEAGYGSPIHDLLPFLSQALKTNPKRNDDCVDWVCHYFQYFPFKPDEKLLFLSYLSYPLSMIQAAQNYHQRQPNKKNELKLIKFLQRTYWHLKNTEYVAMRIAEHGSAPEIKEGAPES